MNRSDKNISSKFNQHPEQFPETAETPAEITSNQPSEICPDLELSNDMDYDYVNAIPFINDKEPIRGGICKGCFPHIFCLTGATDATGPTGSTGFTGVTGATGSTGSFIYKQRSPIVFDRVLLRIVPQLELAVLV